MLPETSLHAVMDAVAGSPLPTTFVDRNRIYRFVNRAYERWFGLVWDEVVGRSIEQVLGSQAAEGVEFYVQAALAGGTVEFESSLPYRTRGVRRMKIVYAAAREPDGSVSGFFAYLEDITVRYDAEAAVAAALDGIADGYLALDRQLRFTYVNSAAARLYGLRRSEMLDRALDEVFPGSASTPTGALVKQVMNTGNPQRQELPSAGRPGEVFRFDVIPLMTGGVGVVIQDISEQRKQAQELALASRRFEAAAAASLGVVYEWDPASGFIWRSGALKTLFGEDHADPTPEWWMARMHPADTVEPIDYLRDFGEVVERSYRVRHADGRWIRVLDRASAVRGDDDQVVRVMGAVFALPDRPDEAESR